MIQVKKNYTNIPDDYITLITALKVRKIDIDSGENSAISARDLFEKLKANKSSFRPFKEKLLNDQGYICCYCNCRVQLNGSTIEHIIPINHDKSLLAEYGNLLISCNESRVNRTHNRSYPIHCDASKDNTLLSFSPLDSDCWAAFNYSLVDGSVTANSGNAQQVLDTLMLDCIVLRQSRLDALEILFDDSHQLLSYYELERIWETLWNRNGNNMHEPYFFVIVQNIYNLV